MFHLGLSTGIIFLWVITTWAMNSESPTFTAKHEEHFIVPLKEYLELVEGTNSQKRSRAEVSFWKGVESKLDPTYFETELGDFLDSVLHMFEEARWIIVNQIMRRCYNKPSSHPKASRSNIESHFMSIYFYGELDDNLVSEYILLTALVLLQKYPHNCDHLMTVKSAIVMAESLHRKGGSGFELNRWKFLKLANVLDFTDRLAMIALQKEKEEAKIGYFDDSMVRGSTLEPILCGEEQCEKQHLRTKKSKR
eukprot:g519.t1